MILQSTREVTNVLCSSASRKFIPISHAISTFIEKLAKHRVQPKVKVGQPAAITAGPAKGITGMVKKLRVTPDVGVRPCVLIDFLIQSQNLGGGCESH